MIRGEIRFRIGEEHTVCRAGVVHGFVVLDDDTVVEALGERRVGEWVDGRAQPRRDVGEVKVFVAAYPWCREPPSGVPPTTREELLATAGTTRDLI